MTDLEKLMLLLPIMFMLHEYEEVVMFKQWIFQNRENLKRHFPKVEAFITERGLFDYSTSTFAVGTAHEFILLSVVSFFAVWQGTYQWWFAVLMGHSIHLFIHLAQWIIYRKYIPVIVTTLLTLPYCIYAFVKFTDTTSLSPLQMVLWTVIGITLAALSLLSAFFLMSKFYRWEVKRGIFF